MFVSDHHLSWCVLCFVNKDAEEISLLWQYFFILVMQDYPQLPQIWVESDDGWMKWMKRGMAKSLPLHVYIFIPWYKLAGPIGWSLEHFCLSFVGRLGRHAAWIYHQGLGPIKWSHRAKHWTAEWALILRGMGSSEKGIGGPLAQRSKSNIPVISSILPQQNNMSLLILFETSHTLSLDWNKERLLKSC